MERREHVAVPGANVRESILVAGEGGNDFGRNMPGFYGPSSADVLYEPTGSLTLAGCAPLEANVEVSFDLLTFDWGSGTDDLFCTGTARGRLTSSRPRMSLSA